MKDERFQSLHKQQYITKKIVITYGHFCYFALKIHLKKISLKAFMAHFLQTRC